MTKYLWSPNLLTSTTIQFCDFSLAILDIEYFAVLLAAALKFQYASDTCKQRELSNNFISPFMHYLPLPFIFTNSAPLIAIFERVKGFQFYNVTIFGGVCSHYITLHDDDLLSS